MKNTYKYPVVKMLAVLMIVFAAAVLRVNIPAHAVTGEMDVIVEYHQDMARAILDMINDYRTSGNAWYWNPGNTTKDQLGTLSALQYDYDLEKVAMQRAAEIAVMYSHTRPDGQDCWKTYDECGYSYWTAGENIAAGYSTSKSVHDAWMEENDDYSGQGHRRNILNRELAAVGIGCVYSNGYYYWVEEFSGTCRNSSPTTVSSDPRTVTVKLDTDAIGIKEVYIDKKSSAYYTVWDDGPANVYYQDDDHWNWGVNFYHYIGLMPGETVDNPVKGYLFSYTKYARDWSSWAAAEDPGMTVSVADGNVAKIENGKLTALCCGSTELVAEIGGKKYTYPLVVGHSYVTSLTPATPSEDGSEYSECLNCGGRKDEKVIPGKLTVSIDNPFITYTGKSIKPSFTVKDRTGAVIDRGNYTVIYINNKNVGTGTITAELKNKYAGELELGFDINPRPAKIRAVGTKKSLLIKWKKAKGQCDGYEIEYADDRFFNEGEGKVVVEGKKKASKKIAIAKTKQTRYVRIRSYRVVDGKTYYSSWSDAYAFKW